MTKRLIQMRTLGQHGRWGNMVFQASFLVTYGLRHSLIVETSPWPGEYLFGFAWRRPTANLPNRHERYPNQGDAKAPSPDVIRNNFPYPPHGDEFADCNFQGYAQWHTSWYTAAEREIIRALFANPKQPWRDRMHSPVERLRSWGRDVIGLHFRRGDTGHKIFYLTPVEWYTRWLYQTWHRFEQPVVFIATEDAGDVERMRDRGMPWARHVVTAGDLGIGLDATPYAHYPYLPPDLRDGDAVQLDWFPDWWLLTQCDVIAFGNSTFSLTAAMVGRCREAWRSSLQRRDFVKIEPWSCSPLTRDRVEDYPCEGTTVDKSRYWKK